MNPRSNEGGAPRPDPVEPDGRPSPPPLPAGPWVYSPGSGAWAASSGMGPWPLWAAAALSVGSAALMIGLAVAWVPLAFPTVAFMFLWPLTGPVAACAGLGRRVGVFGLLAVTAAGLALGAVVGGGLALLQAGAEPASSLLRRMPVDTAFVAGLVALGPVLGHAVARQWPFGYAVAAVAAGLALLVLAHFAVYRVEWSASMAHLHTAVMAEAQKGQAETLGFIQWHRDNWATVDFGMFAGLAQAAAVVLVWAVSAGLRRFAGVAGLQGSFRAMRPPEALVWAAIACGLLGLAHQQWPLPDWARLVVWNTAIALSATYFLNGLAVLSYAVALLRPQFFVVLVLVLILTYMGFYPVLAFVGLFDTWGEFRTKLDAWAQRIREQRERSEDDDS